jgi:beta-lactam-binding protein with PASTA domain|tara:strand:+ start:28 stop:873 length:846 start_codon:yes stop_codon:yes gene_type:complete
MKIIKFIFSKFFWINLLLAFAALYGVFYYTMDNLDKYTNHNIKIEVPNLLGIQINDLNDTLEELELRYEIRDSIYSENHPMGMIIQQDPKPHSDNFPNYIKPNRNLYLTIVKRQEIYKTIPDLMSNVYSKNIGKSKLEMLGFKVDLEIRNHKDRDKVLEIRFDDQIVKAGRKLLKGSTLKLIYGSGDKGKPIELPDFRGMNIYLATNKANEIGLELEINYNDSVFDFKDSNRAVIYSQYPDAEINNKSFISIGSLVILDANLSTPLDSIYAKDTVGLNFSI